LAQGRRNEVLVNEAMNVTQYICHQCLFYNSCY